MASAGPESGSLEPADCPSVNTVYLLLLQPLLGLRSLQDQILPSGPGPLCQPMGRQDSLCPDLLGWAPHSTPIIPVSIMGLTHTQLGHQHVSEVNTRQRVLYILCNAKLGVLSLPLTGAADLLAEWGL